MSKFLERKGKSLISQPVLASIVLQGPPVKKILSKSTTVVTNFPRPCPMCHFNQCELENHKTKLNLSILMNHIKTLDSKVNKMTESFKETTEELKKPLIMLKKPPDD